MMLYKCFFIDSLIPLNIFFFAKLNIGKILIKSFNICQIKKYTVFLEMMKIKKNVSHKLKQNKYINHA